MGEFKNNHKILHLLANPFLLALLVSILIILLFLNDFPKYRALINEISKSSNPGLVLFDDIDGNGYGDKIITGPNHKDFVFITLALYPEMVHEQWNFRGNYNFVIENYLITGDYDNSNTKEIYVFTLSNDSVFLNGIDYFAENQVLFSNKFISKTGLRHGSPHIGIVKAEMDDLNEDGKKELIFGLNSGFGIYPRQVYAYDIANDTLLVSPKSGLHLISILQADLTGDGKNEIIPWGYASDNINNTSYPYHDASSWLMALNRQLNFIFHPAEFPGIFGYMIPFVMPNKTGKNDFCAFINPPSSGHLKNRLCMFDLNGKIIKEEIIPAKHNADLQKLIKLKHREKDYIGIFNKDGNLMLYDTAFQLIKKHKLPYNLFNSDAFQFDLDGDTDKEFIFSLYNDDQIVITRSDISHPAKLGLSLAHPNNALLSLKLNGNNPPELAIDSGEMLSLISYGINPLYYWRWAIYAGIYLSILLFTLFVRKVQRVQLQKKYDTEKKITELQLKIVRNQLDPHFAFNAINSAIDAINNNKGDEAGQHLQHFSQMYRSLVLSSDKIKQTLKEELEFTENYLRMEQFRFNKKFQYSIAIDPAIDTAMEVPKMIVQSYTENAVKHGLLCKKDGGGILEIIAEQIDHTLILTIKDNGRGRKEAAQAGSNSTGKGLEMMNNLYDLYYKITNRKITAEISDPYDSEGNPSGTSVKVTIPVK
jgi:two-component sensor histidine kinase